MARSELFHPNVHEIQQPADKGAPSPAVCSVQQELKLLPCKCLVAPGHLVRRPLSAAHFTFGWKHSIQHAHIIHLANDDLLAAQHLHTTDNSDDEYTSEVSDPTPAKCILVTQESESLKCEKLNLLPCTITATATVRNVADGPLRIRLHILTSCSSLWDGLGTLENHFTFGQCHVLSPALLRLQYQSLLTTAWQVHTNQPGTERLTIVERVKGGSSLAAHITQRNFSRSSFESDY
eukprot:6176773-Pleurochrysis_carterae.AAC.1